MDILFLSCFQRNATEGGAFIHLHRFTKRPGGRGKKYSDYHGIRRYIPGEMQQGGSSEAGPSGSGGPSASGDGVQAPLPRIRGLAGIRGIIDLLEACFYPTIIMESGAPKKSKFSVSGNDGEHLVEIDFEVNGNGEMCELAWTFGERGNIQSFHLDNAQPVVSEGARHVGVELHIHHGPIIPYVMIEHLNPNSFTNGKFIRSLVYQIQRTYREMFQRDIMTEVFCDDSTERESYWLTHGTGQTYFQGVWGLEYEFLLEMGRPQRDSFLQISREADRSFAQDAFDIDHYDPVVCAQVEDYQDLVIKFDPLFIRIMDIFKESMPEGPGRRTIREVLNEFLRILPNEPLFVNDPHKHQILSANTFMWFFRAHPYFLQIARQVLTDFDANCYAMSGDPYDPEPRQLRTTFNRAPQTSVLRVGASFDIQKSQNSVHVFLTSFILIFAFFISCFKIFIKCCTRSKQEKLTHYFDINHYFEL